MTKTSKVHIREFAADTLTPVAVYERLAALSPLRFLFESVSGGEQVSRYSFLGAEPRKVVRLYADELTIETPAAGLATETRPLNALDEILTEIHAGEAPDDLPFAGGFVGFFGFDFIRSWERLPRPPESAPVDGRLPTSSLGRFDHLVVFDHARQRVLALANEIEGEVSQSEAEVDLDRLSDILVGGSQTGAVAMPHAEEGGGVEPDIPHPSLTSDAYCAAVRQAKEYIAAGDIFQVVLSRNFRLPRRQLAPRDLYRALRAVNPSPYMVLLELSDVALVGASPEMLVRKTGDKLEARPIAGTRPRGSSRSEDRRLADELSADEKERAEHVMLVDLGRNDLGKIAKPGTVEVPGFMEIESYSHVMHLVSSVEAEAQAEVSPLDALRACFPAGTVSGAPKLRAIEIIDQLEPEARGPYAGAAGYISYTGDLDTCITIRTLVVTDDEISVTAGAGIVADSDPQKEEEETRHKAAALLSAVRLARSLERKPE